MENSIGIKKQLAINLSQSLNELLANYQVYYQNLRGFHWNITGSSFFELHAKFEELYTESQDAIDAIAERILTLDAQPLHTFSDYVALANIQEAKSKTTAKETVSTVIENLGQIIKLERNILEMAVDADDEGTNSLMSDYITAQEKIVWMLTAYLK